MLIKKINAGVLFIIIVFAFVLNSETIFASNWYDSNIAELKSKKIVTSDLFKDYEADIKRDEVCDLIVSIYRYANDNSVDFNNLTSDFSDINNSIYKKQIILANNLGFVNGVNKTKFEPKANVTREQLATMIYNLYIDFYREDAKTRKDLINSAETYSDEHKFSSWSKNAIAYCKVKKIINGVSSKEFSPHTTVTRAQALTIINNIAKSTPRSKNTAVRNIGEVEIIGNYAYFTEKKDDDYYYFNRKNLEDNKVTTLLISHNDNVLKLGDNIIINSTNYYTQSYIYNIKEDISTLLDYKILAVSGDWIIYTADMQLGTGVYKSKIDFTFCNLIYPIKELNFHEAAYLKSDKLYVYTRDYLHEVDKTGTFREIDINIPDYYDIRFVGNNFLGLKQVNWEMFADIYDSNGYLIEEYSLDKFKIIGEEIYKWVNDELVCITNKSKPKISNKFTVKDTNRLDILSLDDEFLIYDYWSEGTIIEQISSKKGILLNNSFKPLNETEYIKFSLLDINCKENPRYEAVLKKAKLIISQIIKDGMTDLQKEKAIHDYIVLNTEYDIEGYKNDTLSEDAFSAYGCLVKGIAVCDGYSKAMEILLDMVNIENYRVLGTATNELGTMSHAWNMVKIDGVYYQVDTTWNDPVNTGDPKYIRHKYFNVSDEVMSENHSWNVEDYPKNK